VDFCTLLFSLSIKHFRFIHVVFVNSSILKKCDFLKTIIMFWNICITPKGSLALIQQLVPIALPGPGARLSTSCLCGSDDSKGLL
jgi:hypothetical protein